MSVEWCDFCDIPWDTDYEEMCPICEQELEAMMDDQEADEKNNKSKVMEVSKLLHSDKVH